MTSRRQPPHRRRARRWVIVAGVAALSAGVAAAEPPLLRRLPPVDARPADVAPRFDPAVRTVATDGLTQPGFVTPLPAAITSGFVRHAAPGAESSAPADEPISEPRPVRPAARPKPISRASPLSEAAEEVFPIDLANALGLGGAGHLQVRLARSRTYEAQANYLQAKANWLPSLSFAVAYNHHAGRLQETEGNVIEVSRSSLFVGGGVGPSGGGPLTAGAGGPPRMFVSWSLADAAFDPLVARQLVCAAGASGTVALNDALLDIALRYFDLVEAYGTLANARLGEQAAADLVKQVRAFRASGLATLVDLQRVEIELAARRRAAADAERRTRTASAELARLLRLPPQVRLTPAEDFVLPVNFLGAADPVEVLIARGVASRPELARYRALQQAACWRVKQERVRPWLPSLHLGASGGVFGGGPGSELPNADGRGDVDLLAVWELQNLGVGHVASLRQRRSQLHQTELEMLAMRDRVAAEVATAAADVASYREQVELARGAVSLAKEAHRLIAERVRQREGRPTDLLASINTLGKALDGYTHTAAEHNRSQYRLLRAIGTAPTATE